MDNAISVSELLELVFGKKPTILEEMVAHSSIPSNLLTEDFSYRLAVVLRWRKYIVARYWNYVFDQNNRKMFSSHEGYLGNVIGICLCEHEYNENIFDSFISVCALLSYLSEETLSKVGLDFRDLNPDIVKVFYRDVLKRDSLKCEEIDQFVKYIRCHKYLKWNSMEANYSLCDDSIASVSIKLEKKINKELNLHRELPDEVESKMSTTVIKLVKEIFSNPYVKLPPIPSEPVLIRRLIASSKKEKEVERKKRDETALEVETSHGDSSSNSDSKTDYSVDKQKDIAWHENIIQAVIRYNHSKNADYGNLNNEKYEEANGILGHLKNIINSLIEVLDESNQEIAICNFS